MNVNRTDAADDNVIPLPLHGGDNPTVVPAAVNQVGPGEIANLDQRITFELQALLEGEEEVTEDRVRGMVDILVDSRLPVELRDEINNTGNLDAMKAELASVIFRYFGENRDMSRFSPDDMLDLAAMLMRVLNKEHVFASVHDPALGEGSVDPTYNPIIVSPHASALRNKKVAAFVLWVGSAVTSFMGLANTAGNGIDKVEGWLRFSTPSYLEDAFRYAFGASGGMYVSQKILELKRFVENIANRDNLGPIRAGLRAAPEYRKEVGTFIFCLATALLVFDGVTNTTGIFSMTGSRVDKADQIAQAQGELQGRLDAARAKAEELEREVPAAAAAQAQQDLDEEELGESATGASSRGAMWDAKARLYNEASSPKQSSLRTSLTAAIDESGLMDGQTIEQDVLDSMEESLGELDEALDRVEERMNGLSPSRSVGQIQEDLDDIVLDLNRAIDILANELPEDVDERLGLYNSVHQRLGTIAQASGNYDRYDATRMTTFDFPEVDIDQSEVRIGGMEYRGAKELWRAAVKDLAPIGGAIFFAFAIFLGLAASHADQAYIRRTRRAYGRDRDERDRIKVEYFDKWIDRISSIMEQVLNEGPYRSYFKFILVL